MVGRTPWSAADAPVGLLVRKLSRHAGFSTLSCFAKALQLTQALSPVLSAGPVPYFTASDTKM